MAFNANNPSVAGEFARMLGQASLDNGRGLTRRLRRFCTSGDRPATTFLVIGDWLALCLAHPSKETRDAIQSYLNALQHQLFDNLSAECRLVQEMIGMGFRQSDKFWVPKTIDGRSTWEGLFFTPDTLDTLIDRVGAKHITHYLAFYSELLGSSLDELGRAVMEHWSETGRRPISEVNFAGAIAAHQGEQQRRSEEVVELYKRSKEAWKHVLGE